jgi:hypothetical protein
MNVADKRRLFREVRRVLKFGARFGVYDVVDAAGLELLFPMPWAASPETSFLEPADAYRQSLEAAGFRLQSECDRSDLTMRLVRKTCEDIPEHGAKHEVPPLGLHVLIGPEAPQRLGNMMHALENGMIAPVEFIVRAV